MRSYKDEISSLHKFVIKASISLCQIIARESSKSHITSIVLSNYAVNSGNQILYHINNLKMSSGNSYLITGASGAGKSTFADHIMQYSCSPNSQPIRYFTDREQINLSRDHIFHMGQDFRIFKGTGAENIAFNFNELKHEMEIDLVNLYESIRLASLDSLFGPHRSLLISQ